MGEDDFLDCIKQLGKPELVHELIENTVINSTKFAGRKV